MLCSCHCSVADPRPVTHRNSLGQLQDQCLGDDPGGDPGAGDGAGGGAGAGGGHLEHHGGAHSPRGGSRSVQRGVG